MKGSDPEAFNTPKTGLANAATLVYSVNEVETTSSIMAKIARLFLQITSSNSLFSSVQDHIYVLHCLSEVSPVAFETVPVFD